MTKKEYRTDPKPPSDMFLDVISGTNGHGSDEMECGWCGRNHMCPDNEYAERNGHDREEYRLYCEEEKKKDPEGVVLHYDCDSVDGCEFNSINFVLSCPCNGLAKYEIFIWAERDIIRKYLKERVDLEYDRALQELTFNKIIGIKDTDPRLEKFWLPLYG